MQIMPNSIDGHTSSSRSSSNANVKAKAKADNRTDAENAAEHGPGDVIGVR